MFQRLKSKSRGIIGEQDQAISRLKWKQHTPITKRNPAHEYHLRCKITRLGFQVYDNVNLRGLNKPEFSLTELNKDLTRSRYRKSWEFWIPNLDLIFQLNLVVSCKPNPINPTRLTLKLIKQQSQLQAYPIKIRSNFQGDTATSSKWIVFLV